MCYRHKDLQQIDPAVVSSTSLAGLQQPLGVLLLEESLLHDGGLDEPPSKRSRGRKEIPPDTNKWIHLARYGQLCSGSGVLKGTRLLLLRTGSTGLWRIMMLFAGFLLAKWEPSPLRVQRSKLKPVPTTLKL